MTNILSKIRGSGTFCATLVRNTSKLLSRFLSFYNNEGDGEENQQVGGLDGLRHFFDRPSI